jgi:hypothetical protein
MPAKHRMTYMMLGPCFVDISVRNTQFRSMQPIHLAYRSLQGLDRTQGVIICRLCITTINSCSSLRIQESRWTRSRLSPFASGIQSGYLISAHCNTPSVIEITRLTSLPRVYSRPRGWRHWRWSWKGRQEGTRNRFGTI